jgi:hypothetical protein
MVPLGCQSCPAWEHESTGGPANLTATHTVWKQSIRFLVDVDDGFHVMDWMNVEGLAKRVGWVGQLGGWLTEPFERCTKRLIRKVALSKKCELQDSLYCLSVPPCVFFPALSRKELAK